MAAQVKSADRVRNFGEVNTNQREIQAMLNLVKFESYKIDSKFLEPACGDGNFLIAILERKLKTVTKKFNKKEELKGNLLLSLSSIYGLELLTDNVHTAKERLYQNVVNFYQKNISKEIPSKFLTVVECILNLNILQADTLRDFESLNFVEWELKSNIFLCDQFSYSCINDQLIYEYRDVERIEQRVA